MNLLTTTSYNVFTANTKAKSAEVNSNFTLVKSHLSDFTKDAKHGTIALQTYALASADYTVLDDDGYHTILVTTGNTDRTVTLPTASANIGRIIVIKKVDTGTGIVTIDGEGAESIDDATTLALRNRYDAATLHCDGTGWHVPVLQKKNRFQSKFTAGPHGNSVTALTFSNLVTGGRYRISAAAILRCEDSATDFTYINARHNTNGTTVFTLGFYRQSVQTGDNEVRVGGTDIIDSLVGTTVTLFIQSQGGGVATDVRATLEELNDYESNSSW